MTTPQTDAAGQAGPGGVPDLSGDSAADFEESPAFKIRRLERALADAHKHGAKATRQLHRRMAADSRDELRAARQAARAAEERATRAERAAETAAKRTRQVERELETIKQSRTWRTGRAVLAAPSRIKRWGRS